MAGPTQQIGELIATGAMHGPEHMQFDFETRKIVENCRLLATNQQTINTNIVRSTVALSSMIDPNGIAARAQASASDAAQAASSAMQSQQQAGAAASQASQVLQASNDLQDVKTLLAKLDTMQQEITALRTELHALKDNPSSKVCIVQ
eukprot:TRINITY_DN11921_c0_g2_i1.p2 TRINITY_DN11921_c0_g2~~TRINITY_DN11921_c0_g2_i1.p2  ORF type:complete len:148 (+),score=33.20 TRINITY_DN11921_c0_g2_i1:1229-1672(+)